MHEAALRLHGPSLKDLEIYFAGPPAMAMAVQAHAVRGRRAPRTTAFRPVLLTSYHGLDRTARAQPDDHRLGVHDADHEHGEDSDHDHDEFGHARPAGVDESLWMQDNVVLHSVGIDIGSSSTQVVFSKLHLQRIADQLSTRYVVVLRETLYAAAADADAVSRAMTLIDAQALGAMIEAAYDEAGLHPDEVDAGAVILTGEALRRENGQAIAAMLAEQGGEFVCATAGHHMESHAGGVRLGRGASQLRRKQPHPQRRHRRRHHQAGSRRSR